MLDKDGVVFWMRQKRIAAGLRQEDIGAKNRVCDLENGRRPLTLHWLERYSEALKVPVSELVKMGEE